MKVVIVGDGKVGYALTEELAREGHDVVVIDSKRDVLRHVAEKLDVMVVNGTGASSAKAALQNLGIFYADTLPADGTDGQICLVPVG